MTRGVERPYGNSLAGTATAQEKKEKNRKKLKQNTLPFIHPTARLHGPRVLCPAQLPHSSATSAERGEEGAESPFGVILLVFLFISLFVINLACHQKDMEFLILLSLPHKMLGLHVCGTPLAGVLGASITGSNTVQTSSPAASPSPSS